jgi:uncharacterized protein (DUF58 family)
MVEETTGGAYHSVFKGRGIEFSEVREYTQGDDVRDIDWNVTARMGSPFIKKYVEERELNVMLLVDASASGRFGSSGPDKLQLIVETAALIAFSAIRNKDKVGLHMFTDREELHLPPRSGKSHVLRLIREIVAPKPVGSGTAIAKALEETAAALKKKSVVFLISDLIDPVPYEKALRTVNLRHDLVAVRVLDPLELRLPSLAGMDVEDAETGEDCYFDGGSASARAAYAAKAAELHDASARACRDAKVDMIDMRCGDDVVKPLMAFFKMRGGRR